MAQFNTYSSASTPLNNADTLLVYQSGAVKQATMGNVISLTADASRWTLVSSSNYTATAASASSITFSNTTGLYAGLPLRINIASSDYYCIIDSISGGTVNVRGPAINIGTISSIHQGKPEQVSEISFFVAGFFATNTSTTLLATEMQSYYKWRAAPCYAVQASFITNQADGVSAPKMQILAGGSRLIADNSNTGVTLTSAGSYAESTLMNSTNYSIVRGDAMELEVVTAGGDGNAADLTATLTLVLA
jgi:hypothetical protein